MTNAAIGRVLTHRAHAQPNWTSAQKDNANQSATLESRACPHCGKVQRGSGGGLFVYSMSNKAKPLPMDIIREALEIDPSSRSWLRWKVRPISHFSTEQGWRYGNSMCAGKEAGCIHRNTPRTDNDYFVVRVAGRLYLVHRIVYFLATGEDPVGFQIDHIDGNGLNNNPSNLRLATAFENQRNRRTQKNNTSGRRGVTRNRSMNKWQAQIRINGRNQTIGFFDDIEEASAAYESTARQHFGEFYREEKTK